MKKVSRVKLAKAFVQMLDDYDAADLIRVLAQELVVTGRGSEADLLGRDIDRELLEQRRHLEVRLTLAHELSTSVVKSIEKQLATQVGAKTVHSSIERDPGLLGGFVAEMPDERIDTSLKTKLERLEV